MFVYEYLVVPTLPIMNMTGADIVFNRIWQKRYEKQCNQLSSVYISSLFLGSKVAGSMDKPAAR